MSTRSNISSMLLYVSSHIKKYLVYTNILFLIYKTGLGSSPNIDELDRVLKRAEHLNLHPITYMAALLVDADGVTMLFNRLKFSGYERDMAYFVIEHRGDKDTSRPLL